MPTKTKTKTIQYRYLVTRIDPKTGREGLGSDNNWYMYYANVDNVIKFGLRKVGIPAGQFNIYSAPHGTFDYRFIKLWLTRRRKVMK